MPCALQSCEQLLRVILSGPRGRWPVHLSWWRVRQQQRVDDSGVQRRLRSRVLLSAWLQHTNGFAVRQRHSVRCCLCVRCCCRYCCVFAAVVAAAAISMNPIFVWCRLFCTVWVLTRYCPALSATPRVVDVGYYSIPETMSSIATRTDQHPCEQGEYCVAGRRLQCDAGYFSTVVFRSTPCDQLCPPGEWVQRELHCNENECLSNGFHCN